MRGTSRGEEGLAAIEAAGIEPALADPDRPGTVLDLVGDVAVVVWLLGSAGGRARRRVAAIHGPRLERLLEKLVDTPVRGFVYEAAGSVDPEVLAARRGERSSAAAATWRIPVAVVEADPERRLRPGSRTTLRGRGSGPDSPSRRAKCLNSDRN